MNNPSWLHRIGILEGLSAFALFCVAMPMKYLFKNIDDLTFNRIGMTHGILWSVYAVIATIFLFKNIITIKQYFLLALLSLLPLGPLLADRWVLSDASAKRR